MKIDHLNNGLDEELEKALIGIDMPPLDNYFLWRDEVREVAERLEYHNFRTQPKTNQIFSPSTSSNPSTKDAEEDTQVTGVNALLNLLSNSSTTIINAVLAGLGKLQGNQDSKDNRPWAPWRAQQDLLKLVHDGVCTRCAKPGHPTKNCPTFRSAARPVAGVNAAAVFQLSNIETGQEDL
ncbi:hypothetical protein K3495_g6194 [Podosphaera aphanis]|nr:hypothetical protein K3495_g6194 [Podosphaera aphanis]